MDFLQAIEFFEKTYPGKKMEYDFPVECHRTHEYVLTDGKLNPSHHVECHHVMIHIEGMQPMKVPIKPHRLCFETEEMEKLRNQLK